MKNNGKWSSHPIHRTIGIGSMDAPGLGAHLYYFSSNMRNNNKNHDSDIATDKEPPYLKSSSYAHVCNLVIGAKHENANHFEE